LARARNIKPGFFKNDLLAECSPMARLLFIGLWTMADREGRLEDRPKRIKGEVFPYDNCDVNKLLNELGSKQDCDGSPAFIIRYKAGNKPFVQVVNFVKHQNPHLKESASTIPAPDLHHTCTVLAPDLHHTSPAESPIPITESLLPYTAISKFTEFWSEYPRKKSKGEAEKAWRVLKPDIELFDKIMDGLNRAKLSQEWAKNDGQFIPYPATWLRSRGWEDEYKQGKPASSSDHKHQSFYVPPEILKKLEGR